VSSQRQLQGAQQRFLGNVSSLYTLSQAEVGQDVMLPLTATVYAAGQVASTDRVTIDIGTGYFVEMVLIIPRICSANIGFR